MRCVEFYSGIGGFAAAAEPLGLSVVAAIDVNQKAARVYEHNFPHLMLVRSVEDMSRDDLTRFQADLWWMSPPCQPFTRRGNPQDVDDPRCRSFLTILDRIREVNPQNLAMENVPGFQASRAADRLRAVLDDRGYQFVEGLLCPTQWGIPNRRLRFYLVASLDRTPQFPAIESRPRFLLDFLETGLEAPKHLPDTVADRYRNAIHVIDRSDEDAVTNCFTSAYGRSHVRSGSYLLEADRVRYFTPREILRLLGFPDAYRFPVDLPTESAWRLVGNSLSIPVVRFVLSSLI